MRILSRGIATDCWAFLCISLLSLFGQFMYDRSLPDDVSLSDHQYESDDAQR